MSKKTIMKYAIKHNIPDCSCIERWTFKNKKSAINKFKEIESECMSKGYSVKSFLRNERNSPLRGTIKVEVDGFYYYAELFAL